CEPNLLIADEPTTALDVTVQKTILKLIKDLQVKHGMSAIDITHDLGLLAEKAEKVIVMYKGTVVETGNIRDIFLQPQHPYTRALLSCRPSPASKGKRLPVINDFLTPEATGRSVEEIQERISPLVENDKTTRVKNKAF